MVSLSKAEMRVMKEFEELLWESGGLEEGESLPVQLRDEGGCSPHEKSFRVENDRVVGLSARYCALGEIPSSIGELTSLRELDLTGNELRALPDSVGNLVHLQRLYLDNNQLAALPESVYELPNLEILRLYGNPLGALSGRFGQLSSLRDVSVGKTGLTALPESFWELGKLEVLNVAENRVDVRFIIGRDGLC